MSPLWTLCILQSLTLCEFSEDGDYVLFLFVLLDPCMFPGMYYILFKPTEHTKGWKYCWENQSTVGPEYPSTYLLGKPKMQLHLYSFLKVVFAVSNLERWSNVSFRDKKWACYKGSDCSSSVSLSSDTNPLFA